MKKSYLKLAVSFLAMSLIVFASSCTKDNDVTPNATLTDDSELFRFPPIETNEVGCAFPDLTDATCPADELFNPYTDCLNNLYDPNPDEEYSDAVEALSSLIFYAITELEITDDILKEIEIEIEKGIAVGTVSSAAGSTQKVKGKFIKCLIEVVGIADIKKLLDAYKAGRLTKKKLWKIVKRNLKRKLGPIGAAISVCEFLLCLKC